MKSRSVTPTERAVLRRDTAVESVCRISNLRLFSLHTCILDTRGSGVFLPDGLYSLADN
jgi:hypothetical protein